MHPDPRQLKLWYSCLLLALLGACWNSARPGKLSGPLAATADSIAKRIERITCVGPFDCHGMVGDTLAYYLSDGDSHVEVVARQVSVDVDFLAQTTDSIKAAMSQRYGPPKHCQAGRPMGPDEIWAWSTTTRTFLLSWQPPTTEPSPFYVMLRLVEVLPDQPCDRDTNAVRFA